MAKRKNNYLIQGTILAVSSIIVRFIGLLYKIPLTRIIGDEGMGSYTSAQELYNLALLLSSYSIPLAVSKLVSARSAKKEHKNVYRVFVTAMSTAVITGLLASILVFAGAEIWSEITKTNSAIALRVLAPTIFVFAVMGVMRGLFQGKNTMVPTALSQILEQVINAGVSIGAAYYLMKEHNASVDVAAYGAAGGTAGTFFGALAALAFLALIFLAYYPYLLKKARTDTVSEESYGEVFKIFIMTVLPIVLSQTVYNLSGVLDNTMFGAIMSGKKVSQTEITTLYGVYANKYRQLSNLPIAVAAALGTAIVPTLAMHLGENDKKGIRKKIASSIKLNMFISIPAAIGMGVLAKPIILVIYTGRENFELSANLLRLGSAAIIFFALSTLTNGILQGLNQMRLPVIHAGISLFFHVIIVYVLLDILNLGAYGLVIGNVTFALMVCILNWFSVAKHARYHQEIKKTFFVPLFASGIMGAAVHFLYEGMVKITHSAYPSIIAAIAVGVLLYGVLVFLMRMFTEEEMLELPKGAKLLRLCKRFHLM